MIERLKRGRFSAAAGYRFRSCDARLDHMSVLSAFYTHSILPPPIKSQATNFNELFFSGIEIA